MEEVPGGVLRVSAEDEGCDAGEHQHQEVAVLTLGGEHWGFSADLAPVPPRRGQARVDQAQGAPVT